MRISYAVGASEAGFIRMKSTSKKRTPSIVNLTVKRRYLTEREIERLMDCARKHGRYGHRDSTMILVAYRHGLRASEVCDLQWQQIELSEGRLHVHRVKSGIPSVHPIRGDEMRALRKLRRDYPKGGYVFVSERGGPISPIGFHRLVQRLGEAERTDRRVRFEHQPVLALGGLDHGPRRGGCRFYRPLDHSNRAASLRFQRCL